MPRSLGDLLKSTPLSGNALVITICTVFSLIYIYIVYKKTLVVSSVALAEWCLWKVFRLVQKVLKLYLVHRLFLHPDFYTILIYMCFIYLYVFLLHYIFNLSMFQVKNFYSLFYSFTEYVVYSLYSFLSFLGIVRCCYRSWSSGLWWNS